ncbi:MAG: TraM recognition domain-containing protein [Agitococcus sp.]|nr:TraM recognition domain-containing protein [Agitococcus sp.]MDO9176962.1 TraM recognition domain-containing protein [Agitococcus sp.]
MLLGRKDAWALMGVGLGVAGASPWLAGEPAVLGALAGPALGSAWLTYRKTQEWLNRVDADKREDFILKSDETFGELMPTKKGIRLGYTRDNGLPLDIADTFMTRHTAIIGQSGVGKTILGEYLLWQQAMRGGGFIFIDAKLDAATRDKLAYMMKLAGREDEFYVLNVDDPQNSNTYNPILDGDSDEVASRLLNLLPSAENSPGADYFRQQANYALTVLTGALKSAKRRYNFSDLAIIMQSDRALESLLRLPMEAEVRMTLEVFLNQFRKRDKNGTAIDVIKVKEILGGMAGRIAHFAQGKFGQVFNTYTPEINLTDIVKNNKCLYVMLPTMGKDTAALSLGKMVLSDLRSAVYNIQGLDASKRPDPPFLVFADEMGSYVMLGIARLFEQARSANICMIPAFQTFANLRAISPDFEDIIIGNTWNKIFFKFASKDSPETAAEIIGKTKKFVRSLSLSESEGASANNLRATPQGSASKSGGISESWREDEAYRVMPEHLKSMGMGEAIVMSGARVFHIKTPWVKYDEVPPYKAVRHKVSLPPDQLGLDLKDRYQEFLMAAQDEGAKLAEIDNNSFKNPPSA